MSPKEFSQYSPVTSTCMVQLISPRIDWRLVRSLEHVRAKSEELPQLIWPLCRLHTRLELGCQYLAVHTVPQDQHKPQRHQPDVPGKPSAEQRTPSSQSAACEHNKTLPAHTVLGKHARAVADSGPSGAAGVADEEGYRAERVPRTDRQRTASNISNTDKPPGYLHNEGEEAHNIIRIQGDDWRSLSRGTNPSR